MKREVKSPFGFTYTLEIVSLEEATSLIEQYEGKELSQFKSRDCSGAISVVPYLLNDGRVVKLKPSDASITSSLKAYVAGVEPIEKHILTTYPRKRIEYLPEAKKIYYYELGQAEGERITILYDALDKSLYPYSTQYDIYSTRDNEIMEHQKIGNYYRLYQTVEDYQYLQEKRIIITQLGLDRRNFVSQDSYGFIDLNMCGRNPYGESFLDHVDELVTQLAELLHISDDVFSYTVHSTTLLDRYLYRHLITDDFSDKIFLPLLSYIGESYIKRTNSSWEMRYDKTFKSWTPDIYEEGKGFKFMYRPLLKILDASERLRYPLATVYHHR